MDLRKVKKLIELVEESGIREIEVKSETKRLEFRWAHINQFPSLLTIERKL